MTTATASRNEVLTENWPLIHWAGRRAAALAPGLDPDDATQAVALRAVRRFHAYDPARGKLSTWLRQLARTVATGHRSYLLSECRDVRREVRGADFARLADPSAADPAEPAADADRAEARALVRLRIDAALARLPDRDREVIELRYGLAGSPPVKLHELDRTVTRQANEQRVLVALGRLRAILREGRDGVPELVPEPRAEPPPEPQPPPPDPVAVLMAEIVRALRKARRPVRTSDLWGRVGLGHKSKDFLRATIKLSRAGVARMGRHGYELCRPAD